MIRLTFDNIEKYLRSKGIRCTRFPRGIKVYAIYHRIGAFLDVQGQCIFRGSIPIDFYSTPQSRFHELLDLFECDTIALVENGYIEYTSRIKAIKPE